MSALKLIIGLWLVVGGLLLVSPIFAAEGDSCEGYPESYEQNGVQKIRYCSPGILKKDSTGNLTCQWDPSKTTCKDVEQTNSTPTPTPQPPVSIPRTNLPNSSTTDPICEDNFCTITSTNYRAPQHIDYTFNNLLAHWVPCVTEGQPLDGTPCQVTVTQIDQKTGLLKSTPMIANKLEGGGALGALQFLSLAMYTNPPIQTAEYLAYVKNHFQVKPAYAQVGGSGANVLTPILVLWQMTRNIAYLIMIIIFLIVGFMIMLRKKINPQTVISVQQAIPGLIISLILITFSYFIAALLVDLAFIGSMLVGKIFENSNIIGPGYQDVLANRTVLDIFSVFTGMGRPAEFDTAIGSILTTVGGGIVGQIVTILATVLGCQIGGALTSGLPVVGGVLGCVGGGALLFGAASNTDIAQMVLSVLVYAVLIVALLIAMFRLLFKLISNYLSIIVLTIIAPLQFLFGALPGNQGVYTNWIKSMLANVLSFPAVFLTFLFAAFLLGPGTIPLLDIRQGVDFPTGSALPLMGGFPGSLIKLLLAYGVLLASPNIPDLVAGALKVDNKAGQAFVGGAAGNLIGGATFGWGLGQRASNIFWAGGARPGEPPRGVLSPLGTVARETVTRLTGGRWGRGSTS